MDKTKGKDKPMPLNSEMQKEENFIDKNSEVQNSQTNQKEIGEKNSSNYLNKLRENPWIISTFVLAIFIILIMSFFSFDGSTGNVVSEEQAADNLLSFIKSQGNSGEDLKINSVEKEGQLYKVILDYQGQDVPVYVSLDGKYLVSDVIPLDSGPALNSPESLNVEVEAGDSPIKGKIDAPVTLIEFSDYQCPFCSKFFTQTLPLIEEQYIKTGKVKLVYKDFPLISIHPEAQKAAEAARCAREQKGDEGYFKMHDKLFENQEDLNVANYKKWARGLGVIGSKFDDCLDKGIYSQAVEEELAYGETLGVTGTPAFFINGKMISGAQPFDVFEQAIDAVLEVQ